MIDAVAGRRRQPLRVHALAPTIEALRAHVFNDVVWPDFARIPSPERPFVCFHPIDVGATLTLGSRRAKVIGSIDTPISTGTDMQTHISCRQK